MTSEEFIVQCNLKGLLLSDEDYIAIFHTSLSHSWKSNLFEGLEEYKHSKNILIDGNKKINHLWFIKVKNFIKIKSLSIVDYKTLSNKHNLTAICKQYIELSFYLEIVPDLRIINQWIQKDIDNKELYIFNQRMIKEDINRLLRKGKLEN